MENIIPILIALKRMLEACHSVLTREVMVYLKVLMKEYREELNGTVCALEDARDLC